MFSRFYVFASFLALIGLWLGKIGSFELNTKLMLSAMCIAGLAPVMWLDTLMRFGLGTLRSIPMMSQVFFRSKRGSTLTLMIVFCLWIWLSPFAKEPFVYRYHLSAALVLVVVFLWLQPPCALMLGASSRSTGHALGEVSKALYPYRVVALLDHRKTGYKVGSFSLFTDNLRTESDYHWRRTVDRLAASVPLIVLDARTDTPIVISEVKLILDNPGRLERSCFIVGPGGEAPALQAHGIQADTPGIRVIKAQEITTKLKAWLKNRSWEFRKF